MKKVSISRDVIFEEEKFTAAKSLNPNASDDSDIFVGIDIAKDDVTEPPQVVPTDDGKMPENDQQQEGVRRSGRETRPPDRYGAVSG